ncbi:GTPase Era [Hyphobacterium sp. CCMP332]|nr:GTPase Era [Hyphobacterium sp. CCMP332]
MSEHKAGFVNIIGKPNAGKSTLMNHFLGEKISIITPKAQTTRHRIMGILNSDDFQIVYSDTPGIIDPAYQLQKNMMKFVESSLEDADIVLFLVDIRDEPKTYNFLHKIKRLEMPVYLLLNKIDLVDSEKLKVQKEIWEKEVEANAYFEISAKQGINTDSLLQKIKNELPEHPPYFPKDEFTDKPERFFVSEIIREKIFKLYKKEIPYSCEVIVDEFINEAKILHLSVSILVERTSQRIIMIGKGGSMLKKVGIESRKDLEAFFGKQVFLQTYVKVEKDWRKNKSKLERLGYN